MNRRASQAAGAEHVNRVDAHDRPKGGVYAPKTLMRRHLNRHTRRRLDLTVDDTNNRILKHEADDAHRRLHQGFEALRPAFSGNCNVKMSHHICLSGERVGPWGLFICALLSILLVSDDSYAMHISEGLLPFSWAILWYAAAIPFLAWGLWRLKQLAQKDLSSKPLVGLMAAVVFIISCMPVPVPTAGTCSHPCGTGMSGILLGPAVSVVVAAAALLIQALFLAHGGLSTLGANVISMGVVGSAAGYAVFRLMRFMNIRLSVAAFSAGLFADWATYVMTALELTLGIRGDTPLISLFTKIVIAFVPTQLPLGILEGFMTAGMVVLLSKKRPDLLIRTGVLKNGEAVA